MAKSTGTNRRDFLKTSAAIGVGVWSSSALAESKAANEQINFACIGVGGKGGGDTDEAGSHGNIVALCDIDDRRLDEKAKKLLDEWIAIEQDEGKRRSAYAPKVLKALPAKKAARYLQIENEFRILLRYDLAATVPLVQ